MAALSGCGGGGSTTACSDRCAAHASSCCSAAAESRASAGLGESQSIQGLILPTTWPAHCDELSSRSERVKGGRKVPRGSAVGAGR